jgi:hypothetical protein
MLARTIVINFNLPLMGQKAMPASARVNRRSRRREASGLRQEAVDELPADILFSSPPDLSQDVVLGTQEDFRLLSPLALISDAVPPPYFFVPRLAVVRFAEPNPGQGFRFKPSFVHLP